MRNYGLSSKLSKTENAWRNPYDGSTVRSFGDTLHDLVSLV